MSKTVIGLIENQSEAQKVVEELTKSGFDKRDIGVISTEVTREAATAMAGASKGIVYGGLAGLLIGAAALAIPGIGAAVVAGPALTLLSTTFGALAGGLIGGLKAKGVPEDKAHFYAEGLRRGGTLITVNARNDELAAHAVETLKRHGAVDMEERAESWRSQGWNGRFEERTQSQAQGTGQGQAAGQPPSTAQPAGTAQPASAQAAQPASGQTAQPAQSAAASPETQEAPPMADTSSTGEEPVALGAVEVYELVIELPDEETEAAEAQPPAGKPGTARGYGGPERRMRTSAYRGMDRRASL
jgi:hypothetical protein